MCYCKGTGSMQGGGGLGLDARKSDKCLHASSITFSVALNYQLRVNFQIGLED